ncbi:MAG TPA: hypothetical protein HA360_02250 [Nanoarchaeota archaeon]|nr:hypothetical protein [Candidatus Woesearchaeota archaeon]HIH15209.1 hypothetical protein [Nanoarchaeota archaeon]HIH59475.1 hypothetical protein [Nanoarchaeota archaeon]HII13873.1 hypothetical protein [Nanoarchaeota archaeon]HIJ04532.1 hypothetical protein [Nanoarchaeota archaeon]
MNKRNLINILLTEAFALATSACCNNQNYYFDGMIGDEHAVFLEDCTLSQNRLYITRTDGTIVGYYDNNNDFKIDILTITKSRGVSDYYSDNELYKDFFAVGESQFRTYLEKILVLKQKKALDDINY